MTVSYMCNPVEGQPFKRLMANIVASLERRPRRVRLIYANPVEAAQVLRTGHFRLVRGSRGIRLDLDPWININESLAAS